MKWQNISLRIVLAWTALTVAQMVAEVAIRVSDVAVEHQEAWVAVTNVLECAALGFVAVRSDWRGWQLGLSLIVIPLAIQIVNIIEGLVFLHVGSDFHLLAQIVLTYVIVLPLWIFIFGKGRDAVSVSYQPFGSRGIRQNLGRFVAADICYIVLYLAAGLIIFPLVRDFYATQALPPMGTILAVQLLCRGPVFVAVCMLLVRMLNLRGIAGVLAVGAVFTTLSGVVPLVAPSPYLPDSVRWVHFFEVVISNFLFGGIVAWFWRDTKPQSSIGSETE